jgi:hypothetical protein
MNQSMYKAQILKQTVLKNQPTIEHVGKYDNGGHVFGSTKLLTPTLGLFYTNEC